MIDPREIPTILTKLPWMVDLTPEHKNRFIGEVTQTMSLPDHTKKSFEALLTYWGIVALYDRPQCGAASSSAGTARREHSVIPLDHSLDGVGVGER